METVFINEENKSKEIQGKNVLSFAKFVLGGFVWGVFGLGGFCPGVFVRGFCPGGFARGVVLIPHLTTFELTNQLLYMNFPSLDRKHIQKDLKSTLPWSVSL